jgi:hypothetical protein
MVRDFERWLNHKKCQGTRPAPADDLHRLATRDKLLPDPTDGLADIAYRRQADAQATAEKVNPR